MLDFFEQQDNAKKNTKKLLWLTAALNIGVVLGIYWVFWAFSRGKCNQILAHNPNDAMCIEISSSFFGTSLFPYITGVCLLILGAASVYRFLTLKSGGSAVAKALGARLVDVNTSNEQEHMYLNIIHEMALAANCPVPAIYIMDKELHINAFAAGHDVHNAAICVTQGALNHFTRDELQAVVAHEFSHVVNGDGKLGMQIMSLLFGLFAVFKVGEIILRSTSRSRSKDKGGAMALGLGMYVFGGIGFVLTLIVRFAVSRQREFLADAAATQFTRNPKALASALKKVGGQTTQDTSPSFSREYSHLFFAEETTNALMSAFATHPPLEERISRLEPNFNGQFIETIIEEHDEDEVHISREEMEAPKTPKFLKVGVVVFVVFILGLMGYIYSIAPDKGEAAKRLGGAMVPSQIERQLNETTNH